jgi:hypothetical protein
MRPSLVLFAGSFAALVLAAHAATAQVEFAKPESFTDAGRPRPAAGRDESLRPLRDHLVAEAARRLPADQALHVTITDVDLAGDFEPRQAYSREVRVVKDIYPPRIELSFRLLRADGSVVKEGARTLRDTSFLSRGAPDRQDSLQYEKAMIDRWLESELAR